jgi:hypothetical protein
MKISVNAFDYLYICKVSIYLCCYMQPDMVTGHAVSSQIKLEEEVAWK